MSARRLAVVIAVLALLGAANGCTRRPNTIPRFDSGPRDASADGGLLTVDSAALDANTDADRDAPVPDATLSPDAACSSSTSTAILVRLPVDIIWVIDNSSSMAIAIDAVRAGMNDFADTLLASGLDYRMIMLALAPSTETCAVSTDCDTGRRPNCAAGLCVPTGSARYPICIPEPLAGPACSNGERFFHVDMDVLSTQPIEQILGSLAQSSGYADSDDRGSAPWRPLLRDGATRTFVVVTDDNARTCDRPGGGSCLATDPPMTPTGLEDFAGGGNPFNSRTLGAGILTPTYGELFRGYTFDAIYGWGSDTDPNVRCTFADGSTPSSSGHTYTALVERTGGVRAQICDGAAAWGPFFDSIATGVVESSRIACEVTIPPPPLGMTLNPARVNVVVRVGAMSDYLGRVADQTRCDASRGGWYYDDPAAPAEIRLCPTSCADAQERVIGPDAGLDVQFGCDSIII